MRHNEIRDVTANLLSQVCHIVATEPPLQPLSGETFAYRSAIVGDEASLDIKASWFLEPNTGCFPGYESISPKCAMLSLHRHRHHPEAT